MNTKSFAQSHAIIALQWLIEPLNEVLNNWQSLWPTCVATQDFTPAAESLQQLHNIFVLANLPEFTRLVSLLQSACQQMTAKTLPLSFAFHVEYASKLIQYEVNRFASEGNPGALLPLRSAYLEQLLGQAGDQSQVVEQEAQLKEAGLSTALMTPNHGKIPLSASDRAKLILAWRYISQQLLQSNYNDAERLDILGKIADCYQKDADQMVVSRLWYVVALWLGSLALNDNPKPHDYSHLLSQLDESTADVVGDSRAVLWLENLLVDVFVALSTLEKRTTAAEQLTEQLPHKSLFFPHVLSTIERLIYAWGDGDTQIIAPLQHIQKQLQWRGWRFFADYAGQLIADIKSTEHDTDDGQYRWQMTTQLQDFYSTLSTFATQDSASISQDSTAPTDNHLRHVRVLVEEIKDAFHAYAYNKTPEVLPSREQFSQLQEGFAQLSIDDAAAMAGQLLALFGELHDDPPAKLAWDFTQALAEGLLLLELFLDGLAKDVFDHTQLAAASEQISKAQSLLGQKVVHEFVADPVVDSSVTRYSDAGEIAPLSDDSAVNVVELAADNDPAPLSVDSMTRDAELSGGDFAVSAESDLLPDNSGVESDSMAVSIAQPQQIVADSGANAAYLQAKQALAADDFTMDAEITEIFIEEAGEVLEAVDDQWTQWQNDPSDLNALKDIRRGFHTLKGSGRMVGANQLGEMAWAVENLLNRVLEGKLEVGADLTALVGQVLGLVPDLVEDFAKKHPPRYDLATVVLQVNNLLAGRVLLDGVPAQAAMQAGQIPQHEAKAPTPIATETPAASHDDAPAAYSLADSVLQPLIIQAQETLAQLPLTAKPSDDIDDDIKDIFIEEAAEVLETITPLFAAWRHATDDNRTLTDIRRGFHTLKGSGRMVGALVLGELAWAVENMLNRVLDKSISVDAGMLVLLDEVLDNFADLVAIFAKNSDEYPEIVTLWVAVAHAYSVGLGGSFAYPLSLAAPLDTLSASDDGDDAALQSMQAASEVLQDAERIVPKDAEEDALCQIFVEEAQELLMMVKSFIASSDGQEDMVVPDDVVRAFHTLRGAIGLAPLAPIGEMGAVIEAGLQQLQHHDMPMTAKHWQALDEAVALIEEHLANYAQHSDGLLGDKDDDTARIEALLSGHDNGVDVGEMIDGLDTLLDAELDLASIVGQDPATTQTYAKTLLHEIGLLIQRSGHLAKFIKVSHALKNAYDALFAHPDLGRDDDFVNKLLAVHGQLTGLFDSLAGSMSLRIDGTVLQDLADKLGEVADYYQAIDSHALIVSDANPASETLTAYQPIDADADLLAIFLEEAAELDSAIGEEFAAFEADLHNMDALKALQRHLHTIKGGARMVGIGSIGDLTHEAESVYEQMLQGRLTPSLGWVKLMRGVQDILSLQLEQVRMHKRTFAATAAIDALQKSLAQGIANDDASIPMPIFAPVQVSTPSAIPEALPVQTPAGAFVKKRLESWQGSLPDEAILAVFLEEAQELTQSGGEDFQVFRNNTGDVATLQALQRKLHTIKGGARMVQASGVADLAHEMETVYEDLATRRRPATRMIIGLLLACHDWLVLAMTLLQARLNPPTPTALIDALKNFSKRPDSLTAIPVQSLTAELDAIAAYEAYEKAQRSGRDISHMPPMSGFVAADDISVSNEMIRISSSLMERMINLSGEAAINRARIDMSMSSLTASIEEMGVTVQRLSDQLRRMDIELEAQILAQIDEKALVDYAEEGFDPLEMDQYSALNQLSRSLSESASDLLDLKATLLDKTRDGENLLLQLSRTQTELQDGLMYSRLVPFSRLTPRLQRIVRQVAAELGKQVELTVINADDEMDRSILERITSPLEHMLRNAIDHGIEMPDERAAQGKDRTGHIVLEAVREGGEIVIHLSDDGAGINVDAVRKKAIAQGLIDSSDTTLSDIDIMQYIFNAGLSTTNVITQISGRGVGMDVVRSEIRQLGGSVSVDSMRHQGSRFTMRVPLTVAVTDTLVVRAADRQYAVPLVQIDRVTQLPSRRLLEYYQSSDATIAIDGQAYRLRYLNEILSGHYFSELLTSHSNLPIILLKNQMGQNLALQVDEIVGSRVEVVVKPLGRQLAHVSGISAATIMGDGSVMFVLDLLALIRNARARAVVAMDNKESTKRHVIMVVDDSVTVRKVTSRFLERQGFEVVVARDGVEAIDMLQELHPDLMLLDIEMPRMDGFEVATQVRNNARLRHLPIIMITSRTGEKHRERALEIGVNDYMGKPFQENDLLAHIVAQLD